MRSRPSLGHAVQFVEQLLHGNPLGPARLHVGQLAAGSFQNRGIKVIEGIEAVLHLLDQRAALLGREVEHSRGQFVDAHGFRSPGMGGFS